VSVAGIRLAGSRIGFWLFFAAFPLVVQGVYGWAALSRGPGKSDFWTFWHAGRVVLHGGDPYPAIATLPHVADKWFAPFVYPPVAAFLFAPLAALPFTVAKFLYFALNLVAVAAALRMLRVRDWRCYSIAFASAPIMEATGIGTISIPLLVVVAAAWRYRDRARAVGPLVAAAVTAKLFLWPLWFWLVRTRRWRAAAIAAGAGFAATVAAWAAIGFAGLRDYPTLLGRMTGLEGPHGYSVYALQRVVGVGDASAARVVSVLGIVALVLVLWWVRDDQRLILALLGVAFLATPILWPHYLVLLFVPIGLTSPQLSRLWFAPLLLWLDGSAWSEGDAWRIVGELFVAALVLGMAIHRSLPPGQRAASGTTRLRSSECLQPTGATSSVV
jgi:alpha-1,2-mannosyltransferase